MKQKDAIIIIMCVVIATIFSYVIFNQILGGPKNRQQKAEVVTPITPEFNLPDKTIFNTEAVNPTKLIEIGPNTNNQPFANQ